MKIRLDLLLVKRGLFSSRNKAQAAIRRGEVAVEGEILDSPGIRIEENSPISIAPQSDYPGRGGVKLARALDNLELDLEDKIVLDGGASTGGFTACLLHRGARKVYAVDVGWGQLDPSLKDDPRVVAIENFNLRYFSPEILSEELDMVVLDLSFISATLVIPPLITSLKEGGLFLTLVKPQFELGPDKIGKKGIVKREEDHFSAVKKVAAKKEELGLGFLGLVPSVLTGEKRNQEFFLLYKKGAREHFKVQNWEECRERFR